ncbi:hypothetical protein J6590_025385 [Homalodisca vitripennis]|nr:hypothetical protein J6590_025385 [Homalodisca vitripennis]
MLLCKPFRLGRNLRRAPAGQEDLYHWTITEAAPVAITVVGDSRYRDGHSADQRCPLPATVSSSCYYLFTRTLNHFSTHGLRSVLSNSAPAAIFLQ